MLKSKIPKALVPVLVLIALLAFAGLGLASDKPEPVQPVLAAAPLDHGSVAISYDPVDIAPIAILDLPADRASPKALAAVMHMKSRIGTFTSDKGGQADAVTIVIVERDPDQPKKAV